MSDLMRNQFEEWQLQTYCGGGERLRKCKNDESYYYYTDVQLKWKAWQASREFLVIELPKPYAVIGDYADCGGGRTVWDAEFSEKITDRMCKKTAVYDKTIFEALGLKVKP